MSIKSLKSGLNSRSVMSGNTLIYPGSFESIATVSVGSGGSSSISFTNIPSTYTHLQLRMFVSDNRATYGSDDMKLTFNSDTGTNYSSHYIVGNGATANAGGYSSDPFIFITLIASTSAANIFGSSVLDILDYKDTNKYKTIRSLSGIDHNGTIAGYGGGIGLLSGNWRNTNAISSINIIPYAGSSFLQYSHFALYGVN